ncbi:diadenylate cyclase [Vibrio vulnificus]
MDGLELMDETGIFLNIVIEKVNKGLPIGFTGLGIILIDEQIGSLPVSPLLSEIGFQSKLLDATKIVDFLFSISNITDERHDGFHIVSQKKGLSKISQYFSPTIPQDFIGTVFDVGARYRTAQYGSLYDNVTSVIVVSQKGQISVAKDGIVELIVE